MNNGKKLLMISLLFITIASCMQGSGKTMIIGKEQITSKEVEVAEGGWFNSFIIHFSNLIYEVNDKKIKIPIFQGTAGDVLYKDFKAYCLKEKYLEFNVRESGFIVKCKKGEVKKTFIEFLNFYRSNILKDVDFSNKSNFDADESGWIIFFKFKVNGIPCVMEIEIEAADRIDRNKINSVYDIMVNENMEYPSFAYSFDINSEETHW